MTTIPHLHQALRRANTCDVHGVVACSSCRPATRARADARISRLQHESTEAWNRRRVAESTDCVILCGKALLLLGAFYVGFVIAWGVGTLCAKAVGL